MALNIQDSRIKIKSSSITTQVPTVAPSNDHTDGSWDALDIYKGELFINLADDRIWFRGDGGIKELAKKTDYTLSAVLADGNTTSGHNIILSDGDYIFGSGANGSITFGNDLSVTAAYSPITGENAEMLLDTNRAQIAYTGLSSGGRFSVRDSYAEAVHGTKIKIDSPYVELTNGSYLKSTDGNQTFTLNNGSNQIQLLDNAGNGILIQSSTGQLQVNAGAIFKNNVTLGMSGQDGRISFLNSTNANTLVLKVGATANDITYILPTSNPTAGQVLTASAPSAGVSTLSWSSAGGGSTNFDDSVFYIYDNGDNTKKLAFQVSGVTTGTTRTLTVPDASGTIALTSDLSIYATVNNTTLTSYLEIPEQAKPATPTNAIRLYADTSNRFSWVGENGYVRTFDGTSNTADRIYTLPDVAGTVTLGTGTSNQLTYWSGTNTIGALSTATYPSLTELSYVKGLTSAVQTQLNAKLIDTSSFRSTAMNPADSTNYFFYALQGTQGGTTETSRRFKFNKAGTVENVGFTIVQSGNGSNETVTVYLRNITTATDYTVGTFTSDFGASTNVNFAWTGLSISVNTTDYWTLKIACPAFATNPTQWIIDGKINTYA